jgi:hypothetical protein
MNVEIGAEAAQFPEKEYISGIAVAVYTIFDKLSLQIFFHTIALLLSNRNLLSPNVLTYKEPKNRFQGTNSARLCRRAGLYDNPIPPRFLAPIDSLKIPALLSCCLLCLL